MRVHRNVRLLGWFYFFAEFRLYGAVAIIYYTQVSGSFALGMSVFAIATLASSLFEVPTGIFSDKVGRKVTLLLGAIASTLSIVFYALGSQYIWLVVGAALEGLARAFASGNNDALLYDTLAESGQQESYNEHLGKAMSMMQVGLAIAVVSGSFIAAVSFSLMMWLSVIPQIISIGVGLGMREPQTHTQQSTNVYAHLRTAFLNIVQNLRLRNLSLASILGFAFGESAFQFRSAFIGMLWPVWALGLTGLIADALAAVGFYFAGRTIKRFGELRLLISGNAIGNLSNLVAIFFPGVLSPILMSAPSAFYGINTVALSGLMQQEFTAEQRATMGSLNSFAGSLAFAVFSFLLGAVADRIGAQGALALATALALIPIIFYWKAFHHQGQAVVETAA